MNNGSNGSDRSEDESVPLHNGRCITYSGNCSVLPSESSCNTHFECKPVEPAQLCPVAATAAVAAVVLPATFVRS